MQWRIIIIKFIVYIVTKTCYHILNSEDWNGLDTSAGWIYQEHQGKDWKEKFMVINQ